MNVENAGEDILLVKAIRMDCLFVRDTPLIVLYSSMDSRDGWIQKTSGVCTVCVFLRGFLLDEFLRDCEFQTDGQG